MNIWIKSLYKEATGKSIANDFDARVLEAETFAELIIRECARVADASNQMKNRPVGVSVGDVIRKNFGVDD